MFWREKSVAKMYECYTYKLHNGVTVKLTISFMTRFLNDLSGHSSWGIIRSIKDLMTIKSLNQKSPSTLESYNQWYNTFSRETNFSHTWCIVLCEIYVKHIVLYVYSYYSSRLNTHQPSKWHNVYLFMYCSQTRHFFSTTHSGVRLGAWYEISRRKQRQELNTQEIISLGYIFLHGRPLLCFLSSIHFKKYI